MGENFSIRAQQVDKNGNLGNIISFIGDNDPTHFPCALKLHQNYPNPFNPTTTITYEVPFSAHIHLEIFSMYGQSIATLADGNINTGYHEVVWDGSRYASGIYLLKFTAGDYFDVKKMSLIK
jgi:hypothetical protein